MRRLLLPRTKLGKQTHALLLLARCSRDMSGGPAPGGARRPPQQGAPRVVILTGPTAVGKTDASIEVAKRLGGEIISADSVHVFRGLDVGSDKVPVERRQGVPHHLIDIIDPGDEYSAGHFFQQARQATEEILQRGNVPIVVGGTGFYLRWFIHGRPETPASSPEAEAKALQLLEQAWSEAAAGLAGPGGEAAPAGDGAGGQQAPQRPSTAGDEAAAAGSSSPPAQPAAAHAGLTEQQRWDAAVALVARLGDPVAAERLRGERNNMYRLQRVLQILVQNGGAPLSAQDIDMTRPLDYDFRCFFLTRPRAELHARITARVEQMVAGGLLREAGEMLRAGITPGSHSSSRAIGYRQALALLQEAAQGAGRVTGQQLQQLVLDIAAATRRLVRNQHTWFRDDDMFLWMDAGQGAGPLVDVLLAGVAAAEGVGGCGNSGRLSRDEARASKTYLPASDLDVFADPQAPQVQQLVEWANADLLPGLLPASRHEAPGGV